MDSDSLPFHQKNLIPKDRLDRGLFVFMTGVIPAIYLWETWIIYQYHNSFNVVVLLHLAFQLFLLVNIIGNLYYLKRIDASGKQKNLPYILKPGWRYCHFCQLNSPPRSYHCPVCDECILKRDRHCMFAGCCVGFHNHRYYFLAVFYVLIGAFYAFFYQLHHYIETAGGFHLSTALTLAAPHIALLTGFLSLYGFILTVAQIILFLAVILTTYLLLQQILCIHHGQTRHERLEGVNLYDLGLYRNVIQVLGQQWYLALLSPFFPSSLPGDGLYFLKADELEEVKDV